MANKRDPIDEMKNTALMLLADVVKGNRFQGERFSLSYPMMSGIELRIELAAPEGQNLIDLI